LFVQKCCFLFLKNLCPKYVLLCQEGTIFVQVMFSGGEFTTMQALQSTPKIYNQAASRCGNAGQASSGILCESNDSISAAMRSGVPRDRWQLMGTSGFLVREHILACVGMYCVIKRVD
jgi:hypothetical protein